MCSHKEWKIGWKRENIRPIFYQRTPDKALCHWRPKFSLKFVLNSKFQLKKFFLEEVLKITKKFYIVIKTRTVKAEILLEIFCNISCACFQIEL